MRITTFILLLVMSTGMRAAEKADASEKSLIADSSAVVMQDIPQDVTQNVMQDIPQDVNFNWKQTILPVSLVGVGALTLMDGAIKDASHDVADEISGWRGSGRKISVDNYLRHAPTLFYLGLGELGVKPRHDLTERLLIGVTSYATMTAIAYPMKKIIHERRPDATDAESFPSGHCASAFLGAELVRIEYGGWYGLGAYTMATGVAMLRMYNGRHWLGDVVAGAGVGILSARVGEWSVALWRKLLRKKNNKVTGDAGMTIVPVMTPSEYGGCHFGVAGAILL